MGIDKDINDTQKKKQVLLIFINTHNRMEINL